MSFLSKMEQASWPAFSFLSFLGSWEDFPRRGCTCLCNFCWNAPPPWLSPYKQLDAGLTFSSKKLLQYAVILLGFGLNISQVFAVGQTSLPVILSTISISLIVAYLFQRFFALDTKLATLIGVGSSICGGSAIAATAPVIHAKEKGSRPSHFRYLFLQYLGCAHLSNPRNLASSIK